MVGAADWLSMATVGLTDGGDDPGGRASHRNLFIPVAGRLHRLETVQ